MAIVRGDRRPGGRQQHRAAPAEQRVQAVRKLALEHGERDHVVQVQALDEHPHEHGGARVLEQHVRRLAQERRVVDAGAAARMPDDRLVDVHRQPDDHLDAHGDEQVLVDARAIVAQRPVRCEELF